MHIPPVTKWHNRMVRTHASYLEVPRPRLGLEMDYSELHSHNIY
jgi:hypothetical protein